MTIKEEFVDEINVLKMFDLSSTQLGIKVHHDADNTVLEATQRLYNKGLISQKDGGYLTSLGRDAAVHAKDLLTILSTA